MVMNTRASWLTSARTGPYGGAGSSTLKHSAT